MLLFYVALPVFSLPAFFFFSKFKPPFNHVWFFPKFIRTNLMGKKKECPQTKEGENKKQQQPDTMQWCLFCNGLFMCVFCLSTKTTHRELFIVLISGLILHFLFEVDISTLRINWSYENMRYPAVTMHKSCRPNVHL